jgi:hypothetical protein
LRLLQRGQRSGGLMGDRGDDRAAARVNFVDMGIVYSMDSGKSHGFFGGRSRIRKGWPEETSGSEPLVRAGSGPARCSELTAGRGAARKRAAPRGRSRTEMVGSASPTNLGVVLPVTEQSHPFLFGKTVKMSEIAARSQIRNTREVGSWFFNERRRQVEKAQNSLRGRMISQSLISAF